MLTGSLYVADSLETGVAITGQKNTGFIRSLGYEGFDAGFPGFLLWSGSAMSSSLGTKGAVPYSGVGLELYASIDNYLRYSTTDSELDIRTDNIFIGNSASFISASNGNITISGSNIDLSTEKFFLGNQSNFISGSNGNIQISGSNVSVSVPTFLLGTKDSQYISGSNGTIEISSSNFKIDTNGDVSANNIRLHNVAYADGFVYTTAVVNDWNYTQYYENYTLSIPGITGSLITGSLSFTKLILDGSKGGEAVSQIRLERQPDWPIGMIIPPGFVAQSTDGYAVTVENWTINRNGNFSGLFFANAVATGSDQFDFGIHADQWDAMTTGFTARSLGYVDVRGVPFGSRIQYGTGTAGIFNTYELVSSSSVNPVTSAVTTIITKALLESQTFFQPYGAVTRFLRTTTGNINPNSGLTDSYWSIVGSDDFRYSRQYFGSLKIGNVGMLIGGNGSMGSQFSDVHYSTQHGSAILQLDARTDTGVGTSSVFIPPRITTSDRNELGDPVDGSIIYNSTTNKLQVCAGGSWVDLH